MLGDECVLDSVDTHWSHQPLRKHFQMQEYVIRLDHLCQLIEDMQVLEPQKYSCQLQHIYD